MLNTTMLIIILLSGFLVFQSIVILKYKKLSISEKTFLATLTHDLKSPANAQINMLNLLLKGNFGKLNPRQYEMIKMTCNSSRYMSDLVGMLLANYKFENKNAILNKKYFDIIKTINDILNQNKYMITDKEFKINFCPKFRECPIFADELQIARVIQNLLSNALTYGKKGTDIRIKINQNSKYTRFSITNKSNPVSKKDLKTIFSKFSQTKNSILNRNTTGLGLYTAKRIIDKHKGIIYAKCTPDGTFTFGFRLKTIHAKERLKV